jgi:3-deoxy-D-manno-octulosonic acid kinase
MVCLKGQEGSRQGSSPPEDFLEIRKAGVAAWVRKGFSFLLDDQGMWRTDLAFCPARGVSPPAYSGRGDVLRISLGPTAGSCAVVRHYERGGLVRNLLGDFYFGRRRFFQEARVSEWARAHDVPTAQVLAVRSERKALCFHRGDLITREIEGSEDLDRYLKSVRRKERPGATRSKEVIRSVALLLQTMHRAGLYHADLNLKNIVVQVAEGAVRSYVIDLDRARVIRPLSSGHRIRNLVRLYRSLDKQGYLGEVVGTRDLVEFVRTYCSEDRDLFRLCKEVMRKDAWLLRCHRTGWRISRALRKMGRGKEGRYKRI